MCVWVWVWVWVCVWVCAGGGVGVGVCVGCGYVCVCVHSSFGTTDLNYRLLRPFTNMLSSECHLSQLNKV